MKIIYINKGNTYYLSSVIATTAQYNEEVVLIGDNLLKKFARKNISFIPFDEYRGKFGYKHISVNPADYEEFCIERWFILKNYMVKNKIDEVWYSDSDNIIYENIETVPVEDYDCMYLKNINHISPHLIYLNLRAIKALCVYLKDFYLHLNQRDIDRVKDSINGRDHISDMYLLHDFIKTSAIKSKAMMHENINSSYDNNIYFVNGIPYLGENKLLNVHFNWDNKKYIHIIDLYGYILKYIPISIGICGNILKLNLPKIYKLLKPYFPDKK